MVPQGTITPILSNPADYVKVVNDYIGNIIYQNSSLKQIQTSEGYCQEGVYYYYLKDHLGNNRYVINGSGTKIETSHYYPFGMRFYIGSTTNSSAIGFRYNTKEFDAMNGLYCYDYGARFYDPQIGRWTTSDPLAEINRQWSPYRYAYDNPLRYVDPDGMTEKERNKAANRMLEHKNKGTTYEKGSGNSAVIPGGKSDCSGTGSECIIYSGETDPNHGNENSGVKNTANNTRKIDNVQDAQRGYLAITHNKSHEGIITNVNKDELGNVTSLEFTHNESPWTNSRGQSGGGKVVSTTIRTNMIGKSSSEGANTYETNFGGMYKWDDLNENSTSDSQQSNIPAQGRETTFSQGSYSDRLQMSRIPIVQTLGDVLSVFGF